MEPHTDSVLMSVSCDRGAWSDRSESIANISPAFVAALGEMQDLAKTETANAGKYAYQYATLASALQMARPILLRHGIGLSQVAEVAGGTVTIWTTILHVSGEYLTARPLHLPAGDTPQQTGSSLSYGKRYALMAVLGLATEDDDGQQASQQRRPAPAPAAAPKPRTDAEAEARRLLAQLSRPQREQVQAMFLDDFGMALRDMPEEHHAAALDWVRETVSALGDLGESLSE